MRGMPTLGGSVLARSQVVHGDTDEVVTNLVSRTDADKVFMQQLPAYEEQQLECRMKRSLGARLQTLWTHTLVDPNDLPFDPAQATPMVFSQFRKSVEAADVWNVPEPLRAYTRLPPLPVGVDVSPSSVGDAFAAGGVDVAKGASGPFVGGETAALDRLKKWMWDEDRLKEYKDTRNGMLGMDYSSKFSPWLAQGCLSARRVYHDVQGASHPCVAKSRVVRHVGVARHLGLRITLSCSPQPRASYAEYERVRVANQSTYWLVFELLWRDYFNFLMQRVKSELFFLEGPRNVTDKAWSRSLPDFFKWANGETGYPLVDACMRELAATGFMSNRGRQIVASFLTKDMGIDWRFGAEWFERHLLDHVSSAGPCIPSCRPHHLLPTSSCRPHPRSARNGRNLMGGPREFRGPMHGIVFVIPRLV